MGCHRPSKPHLRELEFFKNLLNCLLQVFCDFRVLQDQHVSIVKHSDGGFTLQTGTNTPRDLTLMCTPLLHDVFWKLFDDKGDPIFVLTGSAPSLCPADPRDRTNGERIGIYTAKLKKELGTWKMVGPVRSQESSGITIKCSKHSY